MAGIRSKWTGPETLVHGWLKGRRVRHTMHPNLDGHPDVLIHGVDGRPGVIVFINGCFWHGCPEHFRPPKTRTRFWVDKIDRNRQRQREVVRELSRRYEGVCEVAVLWEHDLKK